MIPFVQRSQSPLETGFFQRLFAQIKQRHSSYITDTESKAEVAKLQISYSKYDSH